MGAPGRGAFYFAIEAGSLWMTYKTPASSPTRAGSRLASRDARPAGGGREAPRLVESREEQREDWITLSVFWLLASGADAYVAAQLADFDEHVGVSPTPGGGFRAWRRACR